MRNLLLIVMFVSTSAAAQEFSFDAEAMGKILAGTQALKVKHQGRPLPPMVSDYETRHISFKLISNGSGRDDGGVYVNKAIQIYHTESLLATLYLNDDPRGWAAAKKLLQAFEDRRRDAMNQKRRLVIDYDAISRQNKAGAWAMAWNPNECENFDEIIRLGIVHAGH
ncbi:MAG: hypothetical protein AAB320_00920 [Elusimicrobiota bacterium]